MLLPIQSKTIARSDYTKIFLEGAQEGVSPQQRVCTPCVRVGGGRWCVNLPIVGRRCFSVPSLGTWRACCSIRFGWPPVSCGISRC